ncbi:MAG: endonuclease I family protein [Candidatus Muiribacteriota bacterium]
MKKLVYVSLIIFVLSISVISLDLSNLDGVYNLFSLENGDNIYQTAIDVTSESSERTELTGENIYSVRTEDYFQIEGITFFEKDGVGYAIFDDGYGESCYYVEDKSDFHVTIINVDDKTDVLKIVYDKVYNEFDYASYYNYLENNFKGQEFRDKLNALVDNHRAYNYTYMRQKMFAEIFNIDGYVEDIYIGLELQTPGIPDHTVMNTEHTWPQSLFGEGETYAKKSDFFHCFPADARANSRRSNNPFGWVDYVMWQESGSVYGEDVWGTRVFEVREDYRGDVARGLFYFSIRYNMPIDERQESVLRTWHEQDPVDEFEIRRNAMIEMEQGNRNPFIDRPEFVELIEEF